jgi:hypothetical protein
MNDVETYFVTDIETSGLNPHEDVIFSLGCVVVTHDNACTTIEGNYFYETIDQTTWIDANNWFDTIFDQHSTLSWWLRQPIDVQKAAWRTPYADPLRCSSREVASLFTDFVYGTSNRLDGKPIFAASPVSFDKPFIDQLLRDAYEKDPFDYRTLCIRSLAHGVRTRSKWGDNDYRHKPQVPHHALYDAYAAALDLQMLLSDRDETTIEDQLLLKYTGSNDE